MKKLLLLFGLLVITVACQGVTATPIATVQTQPEPATTTPTFAPDPTATSIATSTATPIPLYFTEEFNKDLSAWTFFQTGGETNPTTSLENDMLRLDISSPNTWYFGIYNLTTYKDVSVSTKFTGSPSGSMGLICRYSESGWYEFNVASDGTYSVLLGQWLSEGIAQYTPIATDTSQSLQSGNMGYEIKLTCQDNILLLYINQNLFRKTDITNYGLPEGKIGITASSFEETPVTMFFEWLQVSHE